MKKSISSYGKTSRDIMDKVSWIDLGCKKCNRLVSVPSDTGAVTCWYCVQSTLEPPKGHIDYDRETKTFRIEEKEVGIKKPKGWRMMEEFVDLEGNVFCYGQEQAHLKGSKPTTLISELPKIERKSRTKKTKKKKTPEELSIEKNKLLVRMNKLKKQLKIEEDSNNLKKIKNELKKINERINKL